jgi:hypothetical protein
MIYYHLRTYQERTVGFEYTNSTIGYNYLSRQEEAKATCRFNAGVTINNISLG